MNLENELTRLKKYPKIIKLIKDICNGKSERENKMVGIKTFSDFVLNRDNLRHILNSGFEFEKEHEFKTIEQLHDKLNDVVIEQKARRLIKKTYSEKYRYLVDDDTLKIFKLIAEKGVGKEQIKNLFSKKIKRLKTPKENNEALNNFLIKILNWNKESVVKQAENVDAEILSNEGSVLLMEIKNYQQSKELGSGQWCLSYGLDHFINYKEKENTVVFFYDFSKKQEDNSGLVGLVLDKNLKIKNAHWKNDDAMEKECVEFYQKIIDKKYKNKKLDNNFLLEKKMEYLNIFEGSDAFSGMVLNECKNTECIDSKIKILNLLNNKKYNLNYIDSNNIVELLKFKSNDVKSRLLRNKVIKIIENSESIQGTNQNVINYLFKENEIDIMKKILTKDNEINNFSGMLSVSIYGKSKDEILDFVKVISDIYREKRDNSNILKSDILMGLSSFSMKNFKDDNKILFINEIIEIFKDDLVYHAFFNSLKRKGKNIQKINIDLLDCLIEKIDNKNLKRIIKSNKVDDLDKIFKEKIKNLSKKENKIIRT